METVFCCLDNEEENPFDYAQNYNVGGLIMMAAALLCIHKNSSIPIQECTQWYISALIRRRIEIGGLKLRKNQCSYDKLIIGNQQLVMKNIFVTKLVTLQSF